MRHSRPPALLKATLWSRRRPLWKLEPSGLLPTLEELRERQRQLRLRGVPEGPFCSSFLRREVTFLRSELVRRGGVLNFADTSTRLFFYVFQRVLFIPSRDGPLFVSW